MKRKLLAILFGVVLLALIGCGKNQPLSGKITFEDGTPLSKGRISFQTADTLAGGRINSDGTYTIGSLSVADGLPKGKTYEVFITEATTDGVMEDGVLVEPAESLIDSKYTSPQTSGLTFQADGSKKTFDITVEKP